MVVATETIFGRIVTGHDVEQWALAVLHKWSSTYLAEVERQHGYEAGHLQRFRGWAIGPTFDKWPEDQVPGVLVVSAGTAGRPVKDADKSYRTRWQLQVGCLASARTQKLSHEHAHMYTTACRVALLQKQSLEGWAAGTDWLGDRYDPLAYDDTRSLYAGYADLTVEVRDVATVTAGPTEPDDPLEPDTLPWPLPPLVETVETEIEQTYPHDEGGTA